MNRNPSRPDARLNDLYMGNSPMRSGANRNSGVLPINNTAPATPGVGAAVGCQGSC